MITKFDDIIKKIDQINPVRYAKNRNFIDGSVSKLSPYISRGVISTKDVYRFLINKGYTLNSMQKFVQEMIWREFWQIIWQNRDIDKDLRHDQLDVRHVGCPHVVCIYNTNIKVFDLAIKELYDTGYMHNHMRMYIASFITNIAKYHWKIPAKWMYYYLLDADWGSNALSWQWVCGTNSQKKYYANQANINKFTKSKQLNTILDQEYSNLPILNVDRLYSKKCQLSLNTPLPTSDVFLNINQKPICIYNFYNLDPNWRKDLDAHRVLLIEPSIFKKYPICDKSMKFMIDLSKNIKDIKLYVGEFVDLPVKDSQVFYKEHPLNYNLKGFEDQRDWICKPDKPFSSFFKHWNFVLKEIYSKKI
tara:strand:+ start:2567 stop:3649 length:1083 start_codon:yes stop_codon:yes gene_type:complete